MAAARSSNRDQAATAGSARAAAVNSTKGAMAMTNSWQAACGLAMPSHKRLGNTTHGMPRTIRVPLRADHANFRPLAQLVQQTAEQSPAEHRRAQVAHVLSEAAVEIPQQVRAVPVDRQAFFAGVVDLAAQLGAELLQQFFRRRR